MTNDSWTDDEVAMALAAVDAMHNCATAPVGQMERVRTLMSKAVELVAARGGTLTAEEIAVLRQSGLDDDVRVVRHIDAQGARIAVVEKERNDLFNRAAKAELDAEEARAATEAIRRRTLEAANLERMISEHGLPAAAAITKCPQCGGEVEEGYGHASGAVQPAPYIYCVKSCGWRHTVKGEVVWNPTREQEAWFDSGAEAMRAACWEAVQEELQRSGYLKGPKNALWGRIKAAIEGATP